MNPLPLDQDALDQALRDLPRWALEERTLVRCIRFRSFRAAIAYMLQASAAAEALDHHPDWTNVYDTLVIRLHTHDAGGCVTHLDVELARRLEKLLSGVEIR